MQMLYLGWQILSNTEGKKPTVHAVFGFNVNDHF